MQSFLLVIRLQLEIISNDINTLDFHMLSFPLFQMFRLTWAPKLDIRRRVSQIFCSFITIYHLLGYFYILEIILITLYMCYLLNFKITFLSMCC